MVPKNIEQITEADLQLLISNSVLEHRTLEYKQTLPGNSDLDKKEFLADVSSFANSVGGDIIYGIISDNSTGYPQKIEGLSLVNADQEIIGLENSIRDGIEPRLVGITTIPIKLLSSKYVIIIRIPRSWNSPHRVTYKGHDKFYGRGSNGKYSLDVSELRNSFNLILSISEKVRNFRIERISKILANDTPVPLTSGAKTVFHVIPVGSFNPTQICDISNPQIKKVMNPNGLSNRYNVDGFLKYLGDGKANYSYSQIFKNGMIEVVDTLLLKPERDEFFIPGIRFERESMETFRESIKIQMEFQLHPPFFLFISLLGVKGYSMSAKGYYYEKHLVDRNNLLIPEVLLESFDLRIEDILKPCFDSVWNACGFAKSLNYDEQGNWIDYR